MSSLSSLTQDIEIQHPEQWTLIVRVGKSSVKFILYSNAEENSLISRELPLSVGAEDYLKALENCVYDNPVLLQDYKKVAVLVESSHFVLLPDEMVDDDAMHEVMDYMYADDGGDREVCSMIDGKVSVAYTLNKGVVAFLRRTFYNPDIVHQLVPLVRYSCEKSEKSSIAKMFVHIADDGMDVCVCRKGELLFANTFGYRSVDEAAYYILNVWQNLELDVYSDELQISSEKTVREQLMPQLRKYISYVMPIIFPASAMKIGQDAIKAPFDLILLSQCVL